ncbi:glycosyltransferase family 4 protein [Nitratidesulfovibrio vulgaris]|uniref:glycosyltransferase family 4 protein n=1 Tax=Nitratidesulfovibrio vulgaris TaxID=881 RepID=UPI002301CA61|nr:glycosyltransferase family 4 protein [Nitratidesulfovibrio vulgaris]WCB45557.1 glycosyltransferase family 4 protein [Nitratidesulfovibrio vulgaris]
MRPAFYLENKSILNVKLDCPENGNPGCGGTEFLFAALPHYLQKIHKNAVSPVLLANHIHNLPPEVESYCVNDLTSAAQKAKNLGCTHFIFRPRRDAADGFYELLDSLQLATIAWTHVLPTNKHIRELAKCKAVKAVVCVEHEQNEAMRDTPLWSKLTYIVNGFDMEPFAQAAPLPRDEATIMYLGALVPVKGFHILARAWPKVLQRHPNARLLVAGTGKVYDQDAPLGSWGLADKNYEDKEIKPFLAGPDGKTTPSVELLGKLGIEKFDYLRRVTLGVANPSGLSENCPGAALEIQACGTPIVSGAYYGMLDTIRHNETGLLGKTVEDLANNICTILEDKELASRLGNNGPAFVHQRYNYNKVTQQWLHLMELIALNQRPPAAPLKSNIFSHWKWAIYLNSVLQYTLGKFMFWPTILELKHAAIALKRKIM